jgi:hypothetical protein
LNAQPRKETTVVKDVFAILDTKDRERVLSRSVRIGVAVKNRSDGSLTVLLDAVFLSCGLQLRERRAREPRKETES